MGNLSDETLINQIAQQERAIAGIRNSYGFAKNPDSLAAATGLPGAAVRAALVDLELDGSVREFPGGRFART